MWRSITCRRSAPRGRTAGGACGGRAARRGGRLGFGQRPILPDQEPEMLALLVGKLEEDQLALGILEALAVPLEESVRAALAADPDHQRLLVVDAVAAEACRAFGEQAVGGPFKEQECRMRLELWVSCEQHLVPLFERAEVLALFLCELCEDAPAARVARNRGRPCIELEPAPLGGNGDAQGVTREEQFGGRAVDRRRLSARPAAF